MELGEKLRLARQEAGLSQRALCADVITRNMLSQIENGSAQPSMSTLRYLAERLGKPVSYFLEETTVVSGNQQLVGRIREAFDSGNWGLVLELLKEYRKPDAVYDREVGLIQAVAMLSQAESAIKEGKDLYAKALLENRILSDYLKEELERRRNLLLAQLPGADSSGICRELPSLDSELMLRARGAFSAGNYSRAGVLLDAVEHSESAQWNLLRGQCCLQEERIGEAIGYLQKAEDIFPKETIPLLEQCFLKLQDYQNAYLYACKGRES